MQPGLEACLGKPEIPPFGLQRHLPLHPTTNTLSFGLICQQLASSRPFSGDLAHG